MYKIKIHAQKDLKPGLMSWSATEANRETKEGGPKLQACLDSRASAKSASEMT